MNLSWQGGLTGLGGLNPGDRLGLMLFVSVAVHLLVIFGIHFTGPERRLSDDKLPVLEVVLVNARTEEAPVAPRELAQASLDGGGNTEEAHRASNPLPPQPREQRGESLLEQKQQRLRALEQEAERLITTVRQQVPDEVRPTPPARPQPAPSASPEPDARDSLDLYSASLDMARLQARVDKQYREYQERPRRKFIGASTREYVFARYLEDWRAKVERVGNLNYPEEARRRRIFGQLRLTVSIRADGSVEKVDIDRSSGEPVLDEAARRIVRMAGPFAPFNAEMREKTDILAITRTWSFTEADGFEDR